MHKLSLARRAAVLACALVGCGVAAHPALAATRFAAPTGTAPVETQCTDATLPCSLDTALQTAQDQDTLSLANGTYNITPKALPMAALHWVATDPQTRPVIQSASSAPTLGLTSAAQSGTTFDHLEIDNLVSTAITRENSGPSALLVGTGVTATLRSMVISGPTCVGADKAGKLEIDDSTLNTTFDLPCLTLNQDATVRRSTVGRELLPQAVAVAATARPRGVISANPVLATAGLVEDSTVNEGLRLTAPTSVARRVRSMSKGFGVAAISGQGLVVDSLATAALGPAIEVVSDKGGTLVVLGSTAFSSSSPALVSDFVEAPSGATANDLVVSNTIARGGQFDVVATPVEVCGFEETCAEGQVHIDHSDFVTRSPATSEPGAMITEGAGNISGAPLFADPGKGDFHLAAGSPAIDAGAVQDRELPSDLDGHARVQGLAPDLGAFETTAPAGPGTGPAGTHGVTAGSVPKLSRLAVSPRRFRVGKHATIVFRLDTSSSVTLTFQRLGTHHRFRTIGHLTVKNGRAGNNSVRFPSRLGGKKLKPGSYKVIALPAHGQAQSVRLTVMK